MVILSQNRRLAPGIAFSPAAGISRPNSTFCLF